MDLKDCGASPNGGTIASVTAPYAGNATQQTVDSGK